MQVSEKAKKEFQLAATNPLPANVRTWTVTDVARWLESLSLGQYIAPFTEGSVDGPFLMELREEDLIQVLGIEHKLHVRKILISREKLKPLSQQEQFQKQFVEQEVIFMELHHIIEANHIGCCFNIAGTISSCSERNGCPIIGHSVQSS